MTRKQKYTYKQRIKACEDYRTGMRSTEQIAHNLLMGFCGSAMVW